MHSVSSIDSGTWHTPGMEYIAVASRSGSLKKESYKLNGTFMAEALGRNGGGEQNEPALFDRCCDAIFSQIKAAWC